MLFIYGSPNFLLKVYKTNIRLITLWHEVYDFINDNFNILM